jgi:D-alanyl-D-alanine carboxypeptidase (penicillin-binding protein 5/6)
MRTGIVVIMVLAVAYVAVQLLRPQPAPRWSVSVPTELRQPGRPHLAWPSQGQAAVAVMGVGPVATWGQATSPQPIASLAKMMTALVVLQRHPLGLGATGPAITFNAADVALYQREKANGQSVVPVRSGEVLSELQALQAMLIPSANNVAAKLADWVAGSQGAFVSLMNREAAKLGLRHTHYADAAGVSPATVSTAPDQLRVAMTVMQNPVFRQIVAMPQVTLPVAGLTYNVDWDLGKNGVVGVKTGSTPQAGGCFVFAGYHTVAGRQALIIGDVLGQPGPSIIQSALTAGSRLLTSARGILSVHTWVRRGESVASLSVPWHAPVAVVAAGSVTTLSWAGLTAHETVVPRALGHTVHTGQRVGTLIVRIGRDMVDRVPLISTGTLNPPSLRWRLTHI